MREAVLLTSPTNIHYHTGFRGSLGYALLAENSKYLFVDFRYISQAHLQSAGKGVEVIMIPKGDISEIKRVLDDLKIKKLKFEDLHMNVDFYNRLKREYQGIELIELGNFLEKDRMVKREDEIESIRKGAAILDAVYGEVLEKLDSFKTEKEVAAFMEYRMKILGAEGPSFDTIVAFGPNSAFPHWKASDASIGAEGFLKIDFGCYVNGYGSDMTRTIYIGKNPSQRHKEIYSIVLEAQRRAVESAREGITTKQLDKVARDYITEKGYGEYFQHGLGHGLGIPGGEMPYLSNLTEEIELKENMVVTIEPGIYIPGLGGVRIEDDVVIKKSGCEVLTKSIKWEEI